MGRSTLGQVDREALDELRRLATRMDELRDALHTVAGARCDVVAGMVDRLGVADAAKQMGVTRGAVYGTLRRGGLTRRVG